MNIIDKSKWSGINLDQWNEIADQGSRALDHCDNLAKEAIIRSDLTVATFYQENFFDTLTHAKRCHELSGEFKEPERYINVLYLESVVYWMQAAEEPEQREELYQSAIKTANLAAEIFASKGLEDQYLKGEIYHHLGAIQANENMEEALGNYKIALESFMAANAGFRCMATQIQIGKISRKLGKPVEFIQININGEERASVLGRLPLLREEERERSSSKKCCLIL